jgi:predicted RNase H-like nuclease
MKLAGIDLAWQGDKNPSAIAIGTLNGNTLILEDVEPAVYGMSAVLELITNQKEICGVAIDAPLVINNQTGQRECEKALGRMYGSRKSSCHPSNKSLYPDSQSVSLSSSLKSKGFQHLSSKQWQIECYPHPAMIECFDLPERLLYKKGNVGDKKSGQAELASLIAKLESSSVLALKIPDHIKELFSASYINTLKGRALKSNEDALDSIMCLYIAGLYQLNVSSVTFGDADQGHIWVPQVKCI